MSLAAKGIAVGRGAGVAAWNPKRLRAARGLLLAAALVPAAGEGQAPGEVEWRSDEIPVNEYTFGPQSLPQVGLTGSRAIVSWAGHSVGNPPSSLLGRVIEPTGPIGGELTISAPGSPPVAGQQIAACADGARVVGWMEGAGIPKQAWFRVFDAAGAPVGPPHPASPPGFQFVETLALGCLAGGEVAVATFSPFAPPAPQWVTLQIFDRGGLARSDRLPVDGPAVSMVPLDLVALPDGGFVLAWSRSSGPGPLARRFGVDGTPRGETFRLHEGAGSCREAALAILGPGRWLAAALDCFDGAGGGPYVAHLTRVDLDGYFAPVEVELPETRGFFLWGPVLASDGARLVVGWVEGLAADAFPVHLRIFDAGLRPLGRVLDASQDVEHNFKRDPDVALTDDGEGVVVWNSYGQDGSIDGVFARFFRLAPHASALEIPALEPAALALLAAALALAALRRLR